MARCKMVWAQGEEATHCKNTLVSEEEIKYGVCQKCFDHFYTRFLKFLSLEQEQN